MTAPDVISALIPRRHKNALKRGIAFGRRLIVRPRVAPTFTVIGAQKAGTTSLFTHLIEHGGYLRPLLKDIFYFDRDYARGPDWYLSFFPTVAEAESRSRKIGGPVVTGELATHYLLHPWAPERMRAAFPEMRIVVLLRDPVHRALSHYYHNVRSGVETAPGPYEAFQLEEQRIASAALRMMEDPSYYSTDVMTYSYLARGRYAEQLNRWFACYPREQMLILSSEQFFADADRRFREICRFIGITEESLPAYPPAGQGRNRREDERAIGFAREYFRPHNEALRALLHEDYGWSA